MIQLHVTCVKVNCGVPLFVPLSDHSENKHVYRLLPFFFLNIVFYCLFQYMYNGNFLEKNASVSVQWNEQNSIDDLSETYGKPIEV